MVSKAKPEPVLICRWTASSAVGQGQTDADDTDLRLLIVVFTAAEQLRATRRGGIDAALRQLRRAAVRADGIRIRQRQRVFSVIDVILLRAEGRHTGSQPA